MSALEFGKPRRRFVPGRGLVYLVLIILIIGGGYLLVPRFEWRRPQIKITPDTDTIGLAPVDIEVNEQFTGLKSFAVVLIAGGTPHPLVSEQYDQPLAQKKFTVALSSKLTGLKEGPAVLRVTARDRSLWNFFRGNESVVQKNLTIDITPPSLELVADDRYVNFGGVGVIVYKPSPDTIASGIKIGTYIYNNEAIDTAYHVGYDLSVTKHYAAEAANSGVVAFVGDLGIYGNTVIIDHGLGLFTLYSHLSAIDVKVGDPIKQQQPIGKTGETGLAVGDHLHFGVYLNGLPVLPVEWWDQKWINDNVQPKLDGSSGENIEQAKGTPPRKLTRKRKR